MDIFERLSDLIAPRLRRGFREAVDDIRQGVSIKALAEAIRARDPEQAIRALGLEPGRWRPFGREFYAGYDAAALDISAGINRQRSNASQRFAVDVEAAPAREWLQTRTIDLIREINEDQKQLVRQTLMPLTSQVDPMLTGETPQKLALDLVGRINRATGKREGGLIGLTASQAKWAENYTLELDGVPDPNALNRALRDKRFDQAIRKAIAEGVPLDEKTREAAINAYRNRALKYRAENISLNEAHAVTMAAQRESWRQAIERGVYQYAEVRRMWRTFGDDRVRPTHAAVPGMNPKGVAVDEPFNTPLGPAMEPGWGFEPGCRCRAIYVIRD